jgi:hypothetical protein
VTFEDGVLKALDLGERNARQVTERLESQVRRTLNRPADDGKIQRYEPKVEETKKPIVFILDLRLLPYLRLES